MFRLTLVSFLLLFIILGCANKDQKNQIVVNTIRAEKEKLIRNFFENGGIVVYNANSDSIKKYVSENFRFFGRDLDDRINYVSSTHITENQLKNENLIFIETVNSDSLLSRVVSNIPSIIVGKHDFYFNGVKYANSKDVMRIFYHNPYNKNKFCYVITGNNINEILRKISFRFVGDINVTESYQTLALGFFKFDKNRNWILDKTRSRNFWDERKTLEITKHYQYISHDKKIGLKTIEEINKINDNGYKEVQSFLGLKPESPPLKVNLYHSFEEKGLITNNTDMSNFVGIDTSVHIVVNNWINGDDFSTIAKFLIDNKLGKSRIDFLNHGLSIYFSNNWGREGYKFWTGKLFLSDNVPPLDSMLNNQKLMYISKYVYEPLSGSFVDFLIKKYGKKEFIKMYKNWKPNGERVKRLQEEWKNFLSDHSKNYLEKIKDYSAEFPAVKQTFLKGVCFAHVGYQIYNGYLSKDAFQSLQKTKKLGVNSFSITPFTSMRNADKPVPFRFWEFAGAENDESLIYLKHVSDELNMSVMMKPHVYLGEKNWPGDIQMQNKKDWNLFFHYYYDWIFNYVMLSEIYKIPMMCIGNELSKTTVGYEKQWVELINKVRGIYDGKITYSANWGEEFENVKFWKHLDFIGLSEYYPLSDKSNPSDSELYHGAERIMSKVKVVAQKYNKKVVFTEVGFRSSEEPWKTSMESSSGKKEIDLKNQERCYNALFKAAYKQKWLLGMYWWKWPSYLGYTGMNLDEPYDLYPPNNKPAEYIMQKWFKKY